MDSEDRIRELCTTLVNAKDPEHFNEAMGKLEADLHQHPR
jgi:hypothetical protein